MSEINEDEVIHVDLVGKRKVYSEAAYNRVLTQRDQLREALKHAKHIATRIQECSIEPDKVYLYADKIKALQESGG